MKKLISKNGLTLTELLVSSFLMGIIMIGTAGFSVAIKRMQDTTDKQAILAMQTAAAMAHIERNFQLVNGALSDTAFNSDTVSDPNHWSVKTDPAQTPDTPGDDIWAILFSPTAGITQYDLYACTQPVGGGAGQGPDPDEGQPACSTNRIQLLDNKLRTFSMTFNSNSSPSILNAHIDVSMTTWFNASAGATDPLDNPDYDMVTRIPTLSHSHK